MLSRAGSLARWRKILPMFFDLQTFRAEVGYLGLSRAIARGAYYRVQRLFGWSAYQLLYLDDRSLCSELAQRDCPYECRFMPARALERFSADPHNRLPRAFIADAARKQDCCLAILDGDALASFGWYSNLPTVVEPGMTIHFDRRYVYMYHGFTKADYRGRNLHGIGLARALHEIRALGYAGVVTLAERVNFASLRSAYRTGFVPFGTALRRVRQGRDWLWVSPGSRAYGVRMEAAGELLYREAP